MKINPDPSTGPDAAAIVSAYAPAVDAPDPTTLGGPNFAALAATDATALFAAYTTTVSGEWSYSSGRVDGWVSGNI